MKTTDIDTTIGGSITKMLSQPVLVLAGEPNGKGRIVFTRHELATTLGVSNVTAASRLTVTLKQLHIRTLNDLAEIGPAALYRLRGVGHVQVYVAMCLLDHYGEDVHAWWGWSTKGETVLRHAREKKKRGAHDLKPAPHTQSMGA